MLNLLLISIVIVFIVDLSGAIDNLSRFIWKRLYGGIPYKGWIIPLIGCSLCSVWWTGILYLLITGSFSWTMLFYVASLAYLTPVIKDLMLLIKDALLKGLEVLYGLID